MIWDPLSLWQLLGLFALSLLVTLAANRLMRGRGRTPNPAGQVVASGLWVLLLFAAGVVAARYIERIEQTALGYLAFATGAMALSLLRAWLYRRAQVEPAGATLPRRLTYLLAATVALLLAAWLLDRPVEPWLFLPLGIGALLPGLAARWGGGWATPLVAGLLALVAAPLLLLDAAAWAMLPLGFLVRLAVDTLGPPGVMWLWPWRETRYRLRETPLPWSWTAGGLALVAARR